MDSPETLTIYQTFHKAFPRNDACPWMQAVGVNGYTGVGVQSDAEGDNISHLNPYYCELTAQYWAWKHSKAEVVGFCHYRRYLNFVFDATWEYHTTVGVPQDGPFLAYLTSPAQRARIDELLGVADALVGKRSGSNRSVQAHYLAHHPKEPWDAFLNAVAEIHPDFRPFLRYLDLATTFSACNMYVMRRAQFHAYCEELFPVIDAVYRQIGTPYDSYNNRYPGFLGERFLSLWLHVRRMRSFEVPVIQLT